MYFFVIFIYDYNSCFMDRSTYLHLKEIMYVSLEGGPHLPRCFILGRIIGPDWHLFYVVAASYRGEVGGLWIKAPQGSVL